MTPPHFYEPIVFDLKMVLHIFPGSWYRKKMRTDVEANMIIDERRQRNRVVFETRVNVKSIDETFISEGTSKNIGMGGIYIEIPDFFRA